MVKDITMLFIKRCASMNIETLNQAKELKKYIDGCDGLLLSANESYDECFVTIINNRGTSNEHYGTIPRKIWSLMLSVLNEEKDKLVKEFEKL